MNLFDKLKEEEDANEIKIKKFKDFKQQECELKKQLDNLYQSSDENPVILNKMSSLYKEAKSGIEEYFKNKGYSVKINDHVNFSEFIVSTGTLTIEFTAHDTDRIIDMKIKSKEIYDNILIKRQEIVNGDLKYIDAILDTDSEEVMKSKLDNIKVNIEILKNDIEEIDNIEVYMTLYDRKGKYSNIQELLNNLK